MSNIPNTLANQIAETGPQVIPVVIVDPNNPVYQASVSAAGQLNTPAGGGAVTAAAGSYADGALVTFGAEADAAATSDAGTFTFMALIKRLLAKFPTIGAQATANSVAVNVASDQIVPMNLKQVNGAALAAGNPAITENTIQTYTRNGQAFVASSGIRNTGAAINSVEFSLFNPAASGKNILVYSIVASVSAAVASSLKLVAADPLLTAIVPTCRKIGAATSVASVSYANTTQAVTGTDVGNTFVPSGTSLELLTNGAFFILPSGAANGIAVFLNAGSSINWEVTASWIEF